MEEKTGNIVPSTQRTRKAKSLAKLRREAAGLGIDVHEGLLVINWHDGDFPELRQWSEESQKWVEIKLDTSPRS